MEQRCKYSLFVCHADFQVRLVGSRVPFAGNIEVLYYGVWGGILAYHMDIRVGQVICRQLGYFGADQVFHAAAFEPLKSSLWIYNITCNGNEANISQCALATYDRLHYYYRYSNLPYNAGAVICKERPVGVSQGGYLLMTVNPNPQTFYHFVSRIRDMGVLN